MPMNMLVAHPSSLVLPEKKIRLLLERRVRIGRISSCKKKKCELEFEQFFHPHSHGQFALRRKKCEGIEPSVICKNNRQQSSSGQ